MLTHIPGRLTYGLNKLLKRVTVFRGSECETSSNPVADASQWPGSYLSGASLHSTMAAFVHRNTLQHSHAHSCKFVGNVGFGNMSNK